MIRKAAGMLNRRTPVTATTNRTMPRFAFSTSSSSGPTNTASRIVATGATTSTSSISGRITLPRTVMLPQARLSAVIARPRDRARARRAQGAREHVSERTRACVSEAAQAATPATAVGGRSLVDAAHDGIEARHHRHRVGDQVVLHQQPDELEVDERGIVDLHPERLVGPVGDRVRAVEPARRLDGCPGATRPRTKEP